MDSAQDEFKQFQVEAAERLGRMLADQKRAVRSWQR